MPYVGRFHAADYVCLQGVLFLPVHNVSAPCPELERGINMAAFLRMHACTLKQ